MKSCVGEIFHYPSCQPGRSDALVTYIENTLGLFYIYISYSISRYIRVPYNTLVHKVQARIAFSGWFILTNLHQESSLAYLFF